MSVDAVSQRGCTYKAPKHVTPRRQSAYLIISAGDRVQSGVCRARGDRIFGRSCCSWNLTVFAGKWRKKNINIKKRRRRDRIITGGR